MDLVAEIRACMTLCVARLMSICVHVTDENERVQVLKAPPLEDPRATYLYNVRICIEYFIFS